MEDRPAKMRRLQQVRASLPPMSSRALAAVMAAAAKEQLPVAGRTEMRRARNAIADEQTPAGRLHERIRVPLARGGDLELEIQNPLAMLYKVCSVSASLAGLVRRVAAATPPTPELPWRMVLYTDEILPGNQLGYKSARKMWAVYWSILDWGSAALSDEEPAPMQLRCTRMLYAACVCVFAVPPAAFVLMRCSACHFILHARCCCSCRLG